MRQWRKALAALLLCFGSLSWTSRCGESWKFSLTKGSRVLFRISLMKKSVFIIPSNMRSSVAPRRLIPPQMSTLVGCFGFPLFFALSYFFRNCSEPTFSSWIDDSSEKMAFSKLSLFSNTLMAKASLAALLMCQIS